MTRYTVHAVVFDLDGVLVDSEAFNLRSARESFAARGHELEPGDASLIVGRHPVDYVPVLARRFGIPRDEQRLILDHQAEIYIRLWRDDARLKDGATSALESLRERGFRLGLATSGGRKHVAHCLDRFDIAACFEIVLTKDDVARRKPDPEIYLECARRFGVPAGSMLVVEDSEHGVSAAKAAGAPCVAVITAHTPEEGIRRADARIGSLADLADLVESPRRAAGGGP